MLAESFEVGQLTRATAASSAVASDEKVTTAIHIPRATLERLRAVTFNWAQRIDG